MDNNDMPVFQKYTLTVCEASEYYKIGMKRIRRLIKDNPDRFSLQCGTKQLIIRHKFESFLDEAQAI